MHRLGLTPHSQLPHTCSTSLQVSFSQRRRMGQVKSRSSTSSNDTILPPVSKDIKFRILIIGRANAGKTTILQRISCDSTVTKSPEVFRLDPGDREIRERVRPHSYWRVQTHYLDRLNSTPQWRLGRFILIDDC